MSSVRNTFSYKEQKIKILVLETNRSLFCACNKTSAGRLAGIAAQGHHQCLGPIYLNIPTSLAKWALCFRLTACLLGLQIVSSDWRSVCEFWLFPFSQRPLGRLHLYSIVSRTKWQGHIYTVKAKQVFGVQPLQWERAGQRRLDKIINSVCHQHFVKC